ncbi:MAG: amino acid permease, partial [Bryobacteraceae bacterium]
VPWREALHSKFVGALFMERLYGFRAGGALTMMILWTAFASVFALTLGYSRVPYAAALDGCFFKPFARLHREGFPDLSLLLIGGLAIVAALFDLDWVISALLTARILSQFVAQIVALHRLRKRRDMVWPFRMWLYPLPSLIALAGWLYIFVTSGWNFALFGLGVLCTGVAAYALWQAIGATESNTAG